MTLVRIIFALLMLLGVVWVGYFLYSRSSPISSRKGSSPKAFKSLRETWVKELGNIREQATSSSTIRLPGGTLRMYLLLGGAISWADSADGQVLGNFSSTGIVAEDSRFVSNPAVIELPDGQFLMIYESQDADAEDSSPVTGPRNLYAARSPDGKIFTKEGLAVDSARADNRFASAPDLALLPDGRVRLYYVSGGTNVAVSQSRDKGKTWERLQGDLLPPYSVDPDVLFSDERWVMYFAVLPVADGDPARSAPNFPNEESRIKKAVSDDGLAWEVVQQEVLAPRATRGFVIDPDVVQSPDGTYLMFYGEGEAPDDLTGGAIMLRTAKLLTN